MNLKRTIEQNDTRSGRRFDLIIQGLIVISMITFSIETLPNLAAREQRLLQAVETVIVLIFSAEYLLRILVADNKLKFIFSPLGLVDLAAIAPFYLTAGFVDLRSLRGLRFFRLTRTLKAARYSKSIRRFHRALVIAKEDLILYLLATILLLFFASIGIYYFENSAQPEQFKSVFHSLWWAVVTLTTVGYGDVYPITAGGRAFTFVVLICGLGVVSVPAGLLASALSEARSMED